MRKTLIILIPTILLAAFATGVFFSAQETSITSDERVNIFSAYHYVKFHDYRFNREHPPLIKQLGALPLLFLDIKCPTPPDKWTPGYEPTQGEIFLYEENDANTVMMLARISVMLIATVLGAFIFMWSYRINGLFAGAISLLLFVLSPNLLGHASVFTNDVALSAFFFITCYFLCRYFKELTFKFLVLAALFFGLDLVTKFSSLILVMVTYLAVCIYSLFILEKEKLERPSVKMDYKNIIFLVLIIFTIGYKMSFRIMAPAVFLFVLSFGIERIKEQFGRRVYFGAKVMLVLLTFAFTVVILDYTNYSWFPLHSATKLYFKGFAWFSGHAEDGQRAYLLGKYSQTGWWYYFPLAIFFKTPIPTLILAFTGLVGLVKASGRKVEKLMLLLPVCVYMFIACFINNTNLGIRLVLPVYPFLFVIAGYVVTLFGKGMFRRSIKYITIFLLIYLGFSAYQTFPNGMAYFNEFAQGNSYKILGDSNIEWGQDIKKMKRYIDVNNIDSVKLKMSFSSDKQLKYFGIPYELLTEEEYIEPQKGKTYIISVTQLQKGNIKWLNKYEPVDEIGKTLKVYKF